MLWRRIHAYPEIAATLTWLLATRAVLWLIGLLSREILQPFLPLQEPGAPFTSDPYLAVWGHWDTRWYLDIARRGYSPDLLPHTGEANYAFFPLYPLLMRVLGWVVGDVYLAGLLISNVSLGTAMLLLYRLVRLDAEAAVAERSVKYLILLPTAFLFSGVLTEALFVALNVAAFYAARQNRWWTAGVLGGLAALTRSNGALLVFPLAWMCFADAERRKRWPVHLAALSLVPAGTALFALYTWMLVGDPLAFVHVQRAWHKMLANPVEVLGWGLRASTPQLRVGAWFGLFTLALSFGFCRVLGFPYFLVCVSAVLLPLSTGWPALFSMTRFVLCAWPVAILFARLTRDHTLDVALTACLALLQGFFMVFWSNGSRMVM